MGDKQSNAIGRAKGGFARAAKLSSEERQSIARKGAEARHSAPSEAPFTKNSMPRATHQGRMTIGDLTLDCYVLEDGRRVLNKRGMARALGLKSGGGNAFMKTMQGKGLGSSIPAELRQKIDNPLFFKPLGLDLAHGYEADVLADVAKAIASSKLTLAQVSLAAQAKILISAFAKVGVVALVDEATGYQQIRDPRALRILVQQYIEEEKREWEKQFPDSFYDELNKLYGNKSMTITSHGKVIQSRPQHFANFTRTYVYEPLENGLVLEELDRLNPKIDAKGTRRSRFHQHLSLGYGIEKLKRQVQSVETLVSVADNPPHFKRLFKKKYPSAGSQLDLLND